MLKIPFFRPLNAVVVPIHYEGHTHYFFCDTGVPFSFSKNLTYIPKSISPTKQPFPLKKPPFSLDGLSNSLGVEIAGFLGLDFFSSVPLFGIDFENHCLHFSDFSFKEQLTKPMIIPLLQGPVIMAQVGGQPPRPTFLDFGSYLCYYFRPNEIKTSHQSRDLRTPSPQGEEEFSLYTPCAIKVGRYEIGNFTIGEMNKPNSNYQGVIGNNVLCRFQILFDWHNMLLFLEPNKTTPTTWQEPTQQTYSPGFQCIIPPTKTGIVQVFHRANKTKINPQFTKGTEFSLPHINWNSPEAINQVIEKLHPNDLSPPLVFVEGKPQELHLKHIFDPW